MNNSKDFLEYVLKCYQLISSSDNKKLVDNGPEMSGWIQAGLQQNTKVQLISKCTLGKYHRLDQNTNEKKWQILP